VATSLRPVCSSSEPLKGAEVSGALPWDNDYENDSARRY
jgi:hypothetical protein